MTMYTIKQGESLKLKYKIANVSSLAGYTARVQIKRQKSDSVGECALELTLADGNKEFVGEFSVDDTMPLEPRMYYLICRMEDESGQVAEEIHDKLIVEEIGSAYNPA